MDGAPICSVNAFAENSWVTMMRSLLRQLSGQRHLSSVNHIWQLIASGYLLCAVGEGIVPKSTQSRWWAALSMLPSVSRLTWYFSLILSSVWRKPLLRASNFPKRQLDICLLVGDLITTHEVILPNKLSLNLIKTLRPKTNFPKTQRNTVPWKNNTTGI